MIRISSQPDVINAIRNVSERYKYDKYSARNLVFILHPTEVCHVISNRHEDILNELKKFIDLEVADPSMVVSHLGLTCFAYPTTRLSRKNSCS